MILGHLSGSLDPATRNWNAVTTSALGSGDLVVPNADVHYVLVETPMKDVIAQIPASLHPAIPGVLGITFVKAPESSFGPFELAVVGVACRSGIRPRHMTLAAFTNSEKSAQAFRTRWGFPVKVADVHTQVYYDEVVSVVKSHERPILEVATGNLTLLTGPGATVVYYPALNMISLNGTNTFVQVDLSAEFKRVARGDSAIRQFDKAAVGETRCSPTDPVSGTVVKADITFHSVRFALDPSVSAERGGARKLEKSAV